MLIYTNTCAWTNFADAISIRNDKNDVLESTKLKHIWLVMPNADPQFSSHYGDFRKQIVLGYLTIGVIIFFYGFSDLVTYQSMRGNQDL